MTPAYLRPIYTITSTIRSYLLPLLDQITKKPDLASIVLLLIILFLSLRILNMLWRAVMFWVRLAYRVVFWGGLVMAGLWIYSRGVDGAVEDVGYWTGIWTKEYEYWKDQAEAARLVGNRMGQGNGRNVWY